MGISETEERIIFLDSLRGLAFILVLLYHFEIFSYGWVGVDIFFVISGFIISSKYKNIESLSTFWSFVVARLRRIMPPIFAVCGLSYVAGSLVLLPSEFQSLETSITHSIALIANLHFWKTLNYFNNDTFLMPLIHLWSISAEAQVYLAWGVILLLRLDKLLRFGILVFIFLGLGLIVAYLSSGQGVFFAPIFRMCEFLLGVLATQKFFASRYLSFSIGFLVVSVVCAFSIKIGLGFAASTFGFICLAKRLKIPLIAGIGRFSFSLYVISMPIIAFFNVIGSPYILLAFLVAPIFFLAFEVSRYRLAISLIVFLCSAALVHFGNYRPPWFGNLDINSSVYVLADKEHFSTVVNGSLVNPKVIAGSGVEKQVGLADNKVMFVGDSHALTYFTSVKANPHLQAFYLGSGGCPIGLENETLKGLVCPSFDKVLAEAILEYRPDILVFASRWRSYASRIGRHRADLLSEVERNALTLTFDGDIYVLDQPPEYPVAIPHLVLQRLGGVLALNKIGDASSILSKTLTIECPMEDDADRNTSNVWILGVSKWFRSGEKCVIFRAGKYLYRDSHHLTSYGATEVLSRILEINFE